MVGMVNNKIYKILMGSGDLAIISRNDIYLSEYHL